MIGAEGKRVLVTGAANGCGIGSVRGLIAAGATVFATDVEDGFGPSLMAELGDSGRLTCRALDVSDREAVFRVVDEAASAMGGIDGLVNSAGVVMSCKPEEATVAQFDHVYGIHVMGTVHTNQAVFPYLKAAGGGTILNFGSIAGIRGTKGFSIYGSAKGAIMAWTRNVALEWGEHNIRLNAIVPAMESKMTDIARASRTPEELEQLFEATRKATAIRGALGDPTQDLAPMIVLLISDGGSYITGQCIVVDGGMMMVGS